MASLRYRSIMAVVTDVFAAEQLAATKAAAIASRAGARLTLLNTFMIPQPVPDAPLGSRELILKSAIRERKHLLEKMAAKWRRRGLKIRILVEWDHPAHEAIVRAVLRERPDLVVTQSHRHGRLARWLLANTDWELIRHCPCPVWFVRTGALPPKPKLLVAVDPSHAHAKPARLDDRLLQAAATLTAQLSGAVDVAHAYRAPITSTAGTLAEPFRLPSAAYSVRDDTARLRSSVEKLAARHGISKEDCFTIDGDPTSVVTALVKKRRTDLLVMGAVSRSVLTRPIIGNTAEKIIDHVDCDVLVVKPARFKTQVPKVGPKL